jgi:hypothetical protein
VLLARPEHSGRHFCCRHSGHLDRHSAEPSLVFR